MDGSSNSSLLLSLEPIAREVHTDPPLAPSLPRSLSLPVVAPSSSSLLILSCHVVSQHDVLLPTRLEQLKQLLQVHKIPCCNFRLCGVPVPAPLLPCGCT